jgi:hypothetical protein
MSSYTTRGGICRQPGAPVRYAMADVLASLRARAPRPHLQQMDLPPPLRQADLDAAQAARTQAPLNPPGGPIPLRPGGFAEYLSAPSPAVAPAGTEPPEQEQQRRLVGALADGRMNWSALTVGDLDDLVARDRPLQQLQDLVLPPAARRW